VGELVALAGELVALAGELVMLVGELVALGRYPNEQQLQRGDRPAPHQLML
jgi:hypothetical protein